MDEILFVIGCFLYIFSAGDFIEDDLMIDSLVFMFVAIALTCFICSNSEGRKLGFTFLLSVVFTNVTVRGVSLLASITKEMIKGRKKIEKMKACQHRFTEDGTMYCCKDTITHSTCENNCILCQRGEY